MTIDRSGGRNGWRGPCVSLSRALFVRRGIRRLWLTLEPLQRTIVYQIGYFKDLSTKAARAACGSGILQGVRI